MGIRDGKPMSAGTPITGETVADLLSIDPSASPLADGTLKRFGAGLVDRIVARRFPIQIKQDTYLTMVDAPPIEARRPDGERHGYRLWCELVLVVRGRTSGPERVALPSFPLPVDGVVSVQDRSLKTLEQVMAWYDGELEKLVKHATKRLRRIHRAAEQHPDAPDCWPRDVWLPDEPSAATSRRGR